MISYHSYIKYRLKNSDVKFYRPNLTRLGIVRRTRRVFKKASQAESYGKRLADRFNRRSKET